MREMIGVVEVDGRELGIKDCNVYKKIVRFGEGDRGYFIIAEIYPEDEKDSETAYVRAVTNIYIIIPGRNIKVTARKEGRYRDPINPYLSYPVLVRNILADLKKAVYTIADMLFILMMHRPSKIKYTFIEYKIKNIMTRFEFKDIKTTMTNNNIYRIEYITVDNVKYCKPLNFCLDELPPRSWYSYVTNFPYVCGDNPII